MSSSGMMPPPKTTMSSASRSREQVEHRGEQRHVRAGEHRQPDRVGVLLDRRLDDLLGRLVQAGVDDLHAGVAQRAGDDLGAAVVPVEPGLGDDDPDRAAAWLMARTRNAPRCRGRSQPACAGSARLLSRHRRSAWLRMRGSTVRACSRSAVAQGPRRGAAGAAPPPEATAVELAWIGGPRRPVPVRAGQGEGAAGRATGYSLRDLRPAQRGLLIGDVEAAGTPILLVHGVVDNRSIFTVLRRGLRRRGFGRVLGAELQPAHATTYATSPSGWPRRSRGSAPRPATSAIHLIGHSMGGLVARYYVQRLGGDQRVHTLVTLGTPHSGTYAARLVPHPVARQLRPGSALIAELAEPAPGCRTRFVAFWSDLDQVVIPSSSARLEHPDLVSRNVFISGVAPPVAADRRPGRPRDRRDARAPRHRRQRDPGRRGATRGWRGPS